MEPNGSAERLSYMKQAKEVAGAVDAPSEDEFTAFYLRTYRRHVVLAYATTGSQALAEEIVQDAFVQLYRRWGEVRAPDAWVRRAVTSLSTSWLRRHLVERRLSREEPEPEPEPDSTAGVEVRLMLTCLTPRQRAAIVLRYYEGRSESEIAAALGCRPGTVKSLLSRSITKLEEQFRHASNA